MRRHRLRKTALVVMLLSLCLLMASSGNGAGTSASAQDGGEIKRPADTRVTQEQRQAAADNAKAAGLEAGPEYTAAATAAIGPGDTPDYFGMPNYANSPLPEVIDVPPEPVPPAATTVFYFAEGTTRPGFEPYICIQNPGGTDADVTITYMKGDATTATEALVVPANSRLTTMPASTLGSADDVAHDFSAKVECTNGQSIVAERPMYFDYKGMWKGGHDVVGATGTSSVIYFAEGTTRPGFEPYICIQNPGGTAADVTITYMKGDATTATETLTVLANSRSTVIPSGTLGVADDHVHDFSAKLECTNGQQIVAERPMYFDYKGAWDGGHDVVGATETGTAFFFAEGTTRPGFEPYISIQNPSGLDADVLITYMKGNGTIATELMTVPTNSRMTAIPASTLGVADDHIHDFSIRVECTNGQEILAERPMYFDYKGAWDGGHDVVGTKVTSTAFFFAEGTTRPNFEPYICIQNPGGTAADVTITYMKGDATTATESLNVMPNSRATVLPLNTLGSADDVAHDFSAKVECTNGQQIVAERPMYFNYKGAWDGGHDVIGLPEASSSVIPARKTVVAGTGMRKFVDTLPGLGVANANNLGQYIPVAIPDTTTYPGSDYYEIELGEYTEQLHSDLPPTTLQGYRQTNTSDPTVSVFNYLGPMIVSQRDRPVRVKFTNNLPTGEGGDLFLPVDTTMMGAGMGPNMAMPMHAMQVGGTGATIEVMTMGAHTFQAGMRVKFKDFEPAAYNGDFTVLADGLDAMHFRVTLDEDPGGPATVLGDIAELYTQNRAAVHLHGGFTPWISDGTPHQWITPAGENTSYPRGVSAANVPDMPDPGDGSMTFFYTNQQSARLQFYHDHAWGITRLNVYAGQAAPYIIEDQVEKDLIYGTNVSGVNPGLVKVIPEEQIPLVIQDKTFVPDAEQLAWQDPTWDPALWGGMGNLWFPHVYMPNQNPADPGGFNAFARWHYGPWFWPPTDNIKYGPVPNPYYDPVNAPWENETIPGVPDVSGVMESFMDTPLVNGTAYPSLTVEPKAYRFRVLSIANDRFFNLQLYEADPTVVTPDGRTDTEVKMVPANATEGFPEAWPTDGREGGVPDPATAGPDWIQIGTEGGFLPAPAVIPNQPIAWQMDPTLFNVGNVTDKTVLLGPAERADVIVDFSAYAGKTLILYNDCPAPFPAGDPRYDYYTGAPDQTDTGGAPETVAGYGSNTRTIMQIKVAAAPNPAPYNVDALMAVWAEKDTKPGVFASSQDPILVPGSAYNSAYNADFTADPYVRIFEFEKTFQTISGATVTIPFEPKAIQDEMGEAFDMDYGRMAGFLGLELPNTGSQNQNFILYPFSSPPVDITIDNITPSEPLPGDETQIWKITHNGVDTHPMHFHLFNVQLINRVAWDNMVMPPDPNELGWKETVRVNPLEDTIIAVRPYAPDLPFEVPDSIRPIDPCMPVGAPLMDPPPTGEWFDIGGTPVITDGVEGLLTNALVNFGWEYMMHCHILSHEEMDMMHTLVFTPARVAPADPDGLAVVAEAGPQVALTWNDNSTNETHFIIQRTTDPMSVPWDTMANAWTSDRAGTGTQSFTDTAVQAGTTYYYRVFATNAVGYLPPIPYAPTAAGFPTVQADSAPSNEASAAIP
ncbi:MAG: multicopper oxidase domain-containing protein [Actinomycetota bacterium]|nr:multicopper oxidase domain-containing protein [Actinomycetota bacterium]